MFFTICLTSRKNFFGPSSLLPSAFSLWLPASCLRLPASALRRRSCVGGVLHVEIVTGNRKKHKKLDKYQLSIVKHSILAFLYIFIVF